MTPSSFACSKAGRTATWAMFQRPATAYRIRRCSLEAMARSFRPGERKSKSKSRTFAPECASGRSLRSGADAKCLSGRSCRTISPRRLERVRCGGSDAPKASLGSDGRLLEPARVFGGAIEVLARLESLVLARQRKVSRS